MITSSSQQAGCQEMKCHRPGAMCASLAASSEALPSHSQHCGHPKGLYQGSPVLDPYTGHHPLSRMSFAHSCGCSLHLVQYPDLNVHLWSRITEKLKYCKFWRPSQGLLWS